jgi:hypothetical protein
LAEYKIFRDSFYGVSNDLLEKNIINQCTFPSSKIEDISIEKDKLVELDKTQTSQIDDISCPVCLNIVRLPG